MTGEDMGQRVWEAVFGRPPRLRWWRPKKGGPIFAWLVEPIDGKYASVVYVPRGRGSRSGKTGEWKLDERLTAIHDRRKDGRARALRLYQAYYDRGCSIAQLADGSYLDAVRESDVG